MHNLISEQTRNANKLVGDSVNLRTYSADGGVATVVCGPACVETLTVLFEASAPDAAGDLFVGAVEIGPLYRVIDGCATPDERLARAHEILAAVAAQDS